VGPPAWADPLAAADPLVAASIDGPPAVVPGADAPTRNAAAHAATPTPADTDTEVAATEWAAMHELGVLATPPAAEPPPHRTPPQGRDRVITERALAVVPPAEAWPEDVWAGAAESEPSEQTPLLVPSAELAAAEQGSGTHAAPAAGAGPTDDRIATAHPATLANDVASAPGDDATLGSIAVEGSTAVYPPSVPDRAEAYGPEAAPDLHAAPSAVYEPDSATAWNEATAGEGRASNEGGAAVNPERSEAVEMLARAAAAERLRRLADELDAGTLTAAPIVQSARDSELLVALLAGLLRSGR
jgi:hypothetical protein